MSAADEAVVRRFYEQMNNERKNELAPELFTESHVMHDPQVQAGKGPQGMADTVTAYQTGVDGHWGIEEIFSTDDRVVVRWTGSGTHVGEINGIPPTGNKVRVDAIAIHRMEGDKIAETWEVWDTLGFLQQLGVVPAR
ncbi:MAG: ester cyclase [Acidimicrobiia bacterium]|nr:ester cyclase [Acidimicrobiia bacterium]MBV8561259.1 ester cyclase [Acidimicrobiia bacterium]